ncbi:AgrD family cyclic lactone autoinducer peptide [Cellulosilyticum ruminicola]
MKLILLILLEKVARRSAYKAISYQSDWWCYQTKVPEQLLNKAK